MKKPGLIDIYKVAQINQEGNKMRIDPKFSGKVYTKNRYGDEIELIMESGRIIETSFGTTNAQF